MTPDLLNSAFQTVGGALIFLHVRQAIIHRAMVGVHWYPIAFYFVWGIWTVGFYAYLGQWWSTAAAVLPPLGNGAYLLCYRRYRNV